MTERGTALTVAGTGALLFFLLFGGGLPRTAGPNPVVSTLDRRPPEVVAPLPVPEFKQGQALIQAFLGRPLNARSTRGAPLEVEQVIVATLPDPHESHLDWMWDSQLESSRRAFELAGYVTDRTWFPGRRDLGVGLQDQPVDTTSPLREWPAVLLFRRASADARKVILLYVVGEIPSGGVHKAALHRALQERTWIIQEASRPLNVVRPDSVLRIIGPTFSGSALSLRLMLDSLAPAPRAVELVSGTATSLSNRRTFEAGRPGTTFRATLHSDASMFQVLDEHVLKPLNLRRSDVALLQEFSTVYGRTIVSTPTAEQIAADAGDRGSYLRVPFPASISRLRTEFQRHPEARQAEPAPASGMARKPRLPLDLMDPQRREDLPVTSRMTSPSVDMVLDQLAHTLSERRIGMVGILATDVRDKLFLASELRRRMRDVQFFTFGTNSLLLRSDWTSALHGALILATYPLALETQRSRVNPSPAQVFPFPSDAAQGTFNATLAQLGQRSRMLDYGSPEGFSRRPPVWLAVVGNGSFLPLRAIAVDTISRCYMLSGIRSDSMPRCPEFREGAAPATIETEDVWTRSRTTFDPFALLTCLFLVGVILAVCARPTLDLARTIRATVRRLVSGLERRVPQLGVELITTPLDSTNEYEQRDLYDKARTGSLELHQQAYGLLLLIALAGTAAPLVAIALMNNEGHAAFKQLVRMLAIAGALVFVAAAANLLHMSFKRRDDTVELLRSYGIQQLGPALAWIVEVFSRVVVFGFGLALGAFSANYTLELVSTGAWPQLRAPMLERLARIDSLASPLMTVLIAGAGFAAWSLWHLRRVRLLLEPTPFEVAMKSMWIDAPRRAQAGVGDPWRPIVWRMVMAVQKVRERLFRFFPSGWTFFLAVVLGIGIWWLLPQFGRTYENLLLYSSQQQSWFDQLLRLSVLCSLVATVWAVCRLIYVWSALRRFLAGFAQLPLQAAMARFAKNSADRDLLRALDEPEHEARAVPEWRRLKLSLPDNPEGLELEQRELIERLNRSQHGEGVPVPEATRRRAEDIKSLGQLLRMHWGGQLVARASGAYAMVDDAAAAAAMEDATTIASKAGTPEASTATVPGWVPEAEDYFTLRIAEYIQWASKQIRHLSVFLVASLVLAVLLYSTYPFYPQRLIRLVFFFIVAAASGSMLLVLVQMNRNEALSRLGNTTPGRVSWNVGFALKVVTVGVIPVLTLLSAEFPALRENLLRWADPLLKTLVP